ncbi:MAG: adenylyltransferase/cytidyltransferase family protein, partial [bacterium]
MKNRIGIFSGSFDPVHEGHIEFALQAIKVAKLDYLYFLPDIEPRHKSDVTHVAHRLEMLNLAIKPHPSLRVLELPDKKFSIATTLP